MKKQTIKERISKTVSVMDSSRKQGLLSGYTRFKVSGEKQLENKMKHGGIWQKGNVSGKTAYTKDTKTGFENNFVNGVWQNKPEEEQIEATEAEPIDEEKKKLDVSEEIIKVNKNHVENLKQTYRDLEQDKLETIESIDSGVWRVGASLAGDVTREFHDIMSVAEQLGTAAFMASATGGMGFAPVVIDGVKPLASASISKWGAYFAAEDLRHVVDAASTVYIDKERQDFFGLPKLSKEDIAMQFTAGLTLSVLMEAGLKGAGKLLKAYKGNLSNWKGSPIDVDGNYRSVKDTVVQAVNDDAGTPNYHETRAYLKGVSDTPIDPRNPHVDGSDAIMDEIDPYKMYINNDVNRPVEIRSKNLDELEAKKAFIELHEYEAQKEILLKNATKNIEQDRNLNIITDLPEIKTIPIEDQIRKLDFEKTNKIFDADYDIKKNVLLENQGVNLKGTKNPVMTPIENYENTLNTLKQHAKSGSFAIFSDGENSISITKNIDDSITKISIKNDQISWFNKNSPEARNRSYQENTLRNIVKYARMEVIQNDGTIKTVSGEKKMFYFFDGKYKEKAKTVLDVLIPQSERQQSLINKTGKGGTQTNIENQTFTDNLFSEIRGQSEQIKSTTASVFEDTLGLHYQNISSYLEDSESGFGLSIIKNNSFINFRKTANGLKKQDASQLFINHLVQLDDFTQVLQTKIGTEIELLPNEFPDIFTVKDGILDFNKEKLFKNGVNDTILDLAVNPNMIDTPDYFTKYGEDLVDSHILKKVIFPYVGGDRINGMAVEKVFEKKAQTNILKKVGILSEDSFKGTNIATQKDVLNGLTVLMKDYISDNPVYNTSLTQEIFDGFKDFSKLPHRYDTPRDRTGDVAPVATHLYDFVFSNRHAGTMSKVEINESLSPITGMLKNEIKTATEILSKESKKGLDGAQISKANIDVAKKATTILNRMEKMLKSAKTNEYISSDRFRKDKRELINLKAFLDLENKNVVDYDKILNLTPKKYEGALQAKDLTVFLKENIKVKNLDIEGETKLISILDDWDKKFSSAYIKKSVTTKKFANAKSDLVGYLENIQADKDLITTLKNLDPKKYTKADKNIYIESIKAVRNHVSNVSEKSKNLTIGIDSLLSDLDGKDAEKVIKYKRFIKKADMVLENAPESEAKRAFKDLLDYKNNRADYDISAKDLEQNILKAKEKINLLSGNAPSKVLAERAKNYREIGKLYKKLGNSLRETKTDNTVKFFSNSDIKETYSKIIDLNKKLGNEFKTLEPLVEVMDSVKKITDSIAESKANSPLQRRQRNFTIKSPSLTSEQTKIMKRAEFVMNKKRLLADKEYFAKTPEEIVKIIHQYDSVADIKDAINSKVITEGDIVKEFVNPKYIDDFNKAYEFASPLMDQVADTVDGTIVLRDLNKDEFALAYAQILDDITKTTQVMNKINIKDYKNLSEIQPYFKDFDNMLTFLGGREDYNRPKGEILYSLIDKNASVLAEHWTLGTSLSTFANRMDVANSSMRELLNLNRISSTLDNGKVVTKEFPTVLEGNMNAVKERLTTLANPRTNVGENKYANDTNISKFFSKLFDISTSIYMIAVGGKEIAAKPFVVSRRINKIEDFSGQYAKFAKQQYKSLLDGITTGATAVPEVVSKCAVGTWNTVSELDRYFGIQKLLNKYTNADLDLRVQKHMDINSWLAVPKTKKDKFIKVAMDRYMSNESFRKVRNQSFASPSDKYASFYDYAKEGFSSVINESHLQINNAQELASAIAYTNASAASLGQLDMISKRAYSELSGNQMQFLRVAGINEDNFDLFKKVYAKFSDKDGILVDIGSVNVAEQELNFAEMNMFDKLKATYHAIRDKGFDESKESKYSRSKFADTWYKIMSKFKRVTVGVALEDVRDAWYIRTPYGTLENRYSAGIKGKNIKDATKYLSTYAGAALNSAIIFTAVGQFGNIVNRFMKADIKQGRKDIAKELGDAEAISNSVKDKDFGKSLQLLSSVYFKNIYENSAAGVFFSEGNILQGLGGSAKQAIVDFNTIMMQQGKDRQELDNFWSAFGLSGMTEDVGFLDAPENRYKILALGHTFAKMSQLKYAINVYDSYKYAQGDYDEAKENRVFAQYHAGNLSQRERTQAFEKMGFRDKDSAIQPEPILSNEGTKKKQNDINSIPEKEIISKEEREKIQKLLDDPNTFPKYMANVLKQMMGLKKDQYDILQTGVNESLHKNGLKDDNEYKLDKIQAMKDLDLDGTISELPIIYRLAINNLLEDYQPKDELDLLETKESMLRDISNDMSIRSLKNKYGTDQEKPKITTLPYIYRLLENELKEDGFDIKQGEILKYARQGLGIKAIQEIYENKTSQSTNLATGDANLGEIPISNLDTEEIEDSPIELEEPEDIRITQEKEHLKEKRIENKDILLSEETLSNVIALQKEINSPIESEDTELSEDQEIQKEAIKEEFLSNNYTDKELEQEAKKFKVEIKELIQKSIKRVSEINNKINSKKSNGNENQDQNEVIGLESRIETSQESTDNLKNKKEKILKSIKILSDKIKLPESEVNKMFNLIHENKDTENSTDNLETKE